MSGDDEGFLHRWSRLKRGGAEPAEEAPLVPTPSAAPPATQPESPLPPLDALTADSDFAPFMRADIDPQLRADALKKLLHDPRFNVMDGLDVYIDDYSKPDPLPEGWLEKMNQVARLGIFKPQETATPAEGQPVAVTGETAPEDALPAPETQATQESSNGAAEAPLTSKNGVPEGS